MPSERIHVIITIMIWFIDWSREILAWKPAWVHSESRQEVAWTLLSLCYFHSRQSEARLSIRLRFAYTFANLCSRARGGGSRATADESAEVAEFCYYYPVNSAVKTQTLKGAARPPLAGATTGGRRTMTRGEEDLFAKLFN